MPVSSLVRTQLPAFVHRSRAAHLHGHPLARAQRLGGNVQMGGPRGHDHHRVHIIPGKHLAIAFGAHRLVSFHFPANVNARLHPVLIQVADTGDLDIGHGQQGLHLALAAAAQANNAQTNLFSGNAHFHTNFLLIRFILALERGETSGGGAN